MVYVHVRDPAGRGQKLGKGSVEEAGVLGRNLLGVGHYQEIIHLLLADGAC